MFKLIKKILIKKSVLEIQLNEYILHKAFLDFPSRAHTNLSPETCTALHRGTENHCNFFQQIPERKVASHFKKNPVMEMSHI